MPLHFMTTVGLLLGCGFGPDEPHAKPPKPPSEDVRKLAAGINRFAFDLYAEVRDDRARVFVSPISIATALGMTYAGAREATAAEMVDVLRFPLRGDPLHETFADLFAAVRPADDEEGVELHIANALWAHEAYRFLDAFLEVGRRQYDARLETLDLEDDVEAARRRINAWVAEQTADRIKELIPAGVLGRTTRLVLTNAIYYKGTWTRAFDPQETDAAPFTRLDGTQVDVPLMHQEAELGYFENADVQVLELPYGDGQVSMVVVLPKAADGLPALERDLAWPRVANWIERLAPTRVRVRLPRWSTRTALRLDDVLEQMGMALAFNPRRADFSGMDGTRDLYIGAVLHEAFVEVNEEGTEAAGATAVAIKIRVAHAPPPVFKADHPFLYLIRDTRSGAVLFLGRFAGPA